MEYNKNPISIREGKAFIDGVEVLDCVKFSMNFTPDVWKGKQLGERSNSSRWLGYDITGSMTRRRSTPWLSEKIKEYIASGATPEFTIQGISDDEQSDYYASNGSATVTAVGCVLTGSLPLALLESDGEVFDETIAFNVKDIV